MRADDIMLTAEELRLRRLQRKRIAIAAVGLVCLTAVVIFAGHPIGGAIKGWQARRHAARVVPLLEKQQWTDARNEALAAYQLRPNEPEAIRAVARYLSRTRQHQALEFWDLLAKKRALTPEDLRDEANVALMSGETQRAAPIVKSLIDRKDAGPADWFLAVQLALQKGNRDEAQSYLQKILAAPSASERDQLQATVAELAISSDDKSAHARERADALDRLEKLSRGKSEVALDALVVRAQRTLGGVEAGVSPANSKSIAGDTPATTSDLARALEAHPLAKAPHKLLALDLRMHADPSQKDALITRGIHDWQDSDATSLLALATWLNGKGEYQRELASISLEKALQTRELFLQHVDALGALNRWDNIKELLEGERFPLDPVMQHMYLARCYTQLGEKTASANNWQRALEAAGNDVQKLLSLADYAEKNGALDIAEAAFNSATNEVPNLRMAQQGRLRVAQAQRDTKKIHAILADMLKLWPNDTAIQNDEGYTRLLLMTSSQPKVESGKEKVENEDRTSDVRRQRSDVRRQRSDVSGQRSDAGTSLPEGENESEGEINSAIQDPKSETGDRKADVRGQTSGVSGRARSPTGPASEETVEAAVSAAKPETHAGDTPATTASELITIERLAETLIKREPASLPHRTLLALALLKQQRPIAALDVYKNINVSPSALTPSALAVHAAVLAANGNRDDARTEIQQVHLDQLLPEEQSLIADLR